MEIFIGVIAQAVIYGLIFFYPAWRILGRAGFSSWLALLVFLPGLGFLILAVMLAFVRWPVAGDGGGRA